MRSTYFEDDDILQIRVSDKPIVRETSQGWHTHISYAEDGTIVEIVLLDALLAKPGVQEAFDALGEEYTALDALWAKEADDRLDAYKRGELRAVALAAVAAKYPNLLTPTVGASD